jgi:hypothetical protein
MKAVGMFDIKLITRLLTEVRTAQLFENSGDGPVDIIRTNGPDMMKAPVASRNNYLLQNTAL